MFGHNIFSKEMLSNRSHRERLSPNYFCQYRTMRQDWILETIALRRRGTMSDVEFHPKCDALAELTMIDYDTLCLK